MADLRGTDRAQLMLITALTIAVISLALILMLNSAIYTQNVASRDLGADDSVALTETNTFIEASERLFHEENAKNHSSQSSVLSAYENGTSQLARFQRTHELSTGTYVGADTLRADGGYDLRQDSQRVFTDNESQEGWTVVESTHGIRNGTLTIQDIESVTYPNNQSFYIDITGGGGTGTTWGLYVVNDTQGYNVSTRIDSGSFQTLQTGTLPVSINLTNASIENTEYPELRYWDDVEKPYRIEIGNGENASGTYSMTVNTSSHPADFNQGTTDPYSRPVVYSVTGTFTYQSPELNYTREFHIAPGEPDV